MPGGHSKNQAKKIVLLIVTGVAFGQEEPESNGISFGGWGRAVFVPVQGIFVDDADPVFKSGVGSGWRPAYMGFSVKFSALDGRIGAASDINGGAGSVEVGDNLHIWAKPFGSDILYIAVGKVWDGRFRGLGSIDDDFNGYVGGTGGSGDPVFQRFADGGALFISQPITGLSVYAFIRPGYNTLSNTNTTNPAGGAINPSSVTAADVYKKIQAGFAYDIPNIGLARAQWFGNSMDFTAAVYDTYVFSAATGLINQVPVVPQPTYPFVANPARIEAAFKLTAVENLNLDIGIKIPIPVEEGIVTYHDNFQANLIGDFTSGDFKVAFGVLTGFGGRIATDVPGISAAKLQSYAKITVIPSFYIAAIDATVGGDIGFKAEGESETPVGTTARGNKDQGITFGIGAWISRDLGKSNIKTGLGYTFPKYGDNGTTGGVSYLTWPIILTASF
ncbi:MAG: hypothetical protein LBG07_06540 [Treponema sp.]|jgi:hypothetical protein|nr:hypothetical protein [Treponema sp.]